MNIYFWDKHHLIHPNPAEVSENGILFTAEYWYLYNHLHANYLYKTHLRAAIYSQSRLDSDIYQFKANPSDPNPGSHYSHDNMTGLYAMMILAGLSIKELPTIHWNDRLWLHPRDIAFYNILQQRKVAYLAFPLLVLMCAFSCLRNRGATSGKLLWWLRWHTLIEHFKGKNKIMVKLSRAALSFSTFLIKFNHSGWADVFAIYFKYKDHPINKLARQLYEGARS